jgi:hypothetical protein
VNKKQSAALLVAEWKPKKRDEISEDEVKDRRAKFGNKVWYNPKLSIKEIDMPNISGKEVLIKVKSCGICGSDIHLCEKGEDGYMLYPGLVKLPVVIGHEVSGEVVKVGSEVEGIKVGDMVVVEEMWYCGECDACRRDYFNQCLRLEEMGFTKNGGFEEYMVANYKYCWKINDFLNVYRTEDKAYEAGSLVEPTCVAYNALFVRGEGFKPGSYVVIWGTGPIGLACICLTKIAGASKVIAFEVKERRRQLAKKVGADYVFDPYELMKNGIEPYEKVLDITNGEGADIQVEAMGNPVFGMRQMQKAMSIGGKLVWIGRAIEEASIYLEYFQTKASQVYGSQGHAGFGVWPNVIRLISSGRLDMTKIITKVVGLEELSTMLKELEKGKEIKVLVKP